jgi:SagB-type dehydrogenase family enzyme
MGERGVAIGTATGIVLPSPLAGGRVAIEAVLGERRSVREYVDAPVTRAQLAQLLWAAQGISGPDGLRVAPSAGALYPLEVLAVAGRVAGLPSGVWRYEPRPHALTLAIEGDRRRELGRAALGQSCVADAAVVIVLAAVYRRTTGKYGERGRRYVHMEVGHAAQNVCLQAVALDLGTVVVGAFEDAEVKRVVGLARDEEPLALIPVGRPR